MQRDSRDIQALYEQHADAVLRYARRRIGPDLAQEVLADVFVVALRKPHEIPDEPRSWLLGVARRLLSNRRRFAARQAALYTRLAERHLESHDEREASEGHVLLALASLKPIEREVLILAGWDGLSPEEGGAVLGISPSAFSSRLHRARQRFAEALEPPSATSPRPNHRVANGSTS